MCVPIFAVISLFVIALCVPTFLVHDIVKVADTDSGAVYTVGLSELSTGNTCFIFKANLWLTGIVFKVIPCLMLFVFTIALLLELDLNKRRRRHLTSGSSLATKKAERKTDRTTHTLIVLMTVFIVTEFPQGVLAVLNGMYPNDIHQFVYLSLGEILDLLSLINCCACVVVYPLMSSLYRDTCRGIIARARRIFSDKAPVKTLLIENTTIRFLDDQDVLL
uniref:G-protein coupled receptors family 1 profile domain-containing protein n=1 Tax=Panagrolaimus sp. PS1159 TaxID=55785 RepID=A0AC35ETM5_9BILA